MSLGRGIPFRRCRLIWDEDSSEMVATTAANSLSLSNTITLVLGPKPRTLRLKIPRGNALMATAL